MSARQDQSGAEKGPDAFRTISEVAEDLDLPQHVLRFWETRFPQIRPLKRGGGRRYYRPDDVELLRGIRHLLYGEGYTIRGVQRILKEEGPRYVQALARDLDAEAPAFVEGRRDAMDDEAPPRQPAARPQQVPVPESHPAPERSFAPDEPDGGSFGGSFDLMPGHARPLSEDTGAREGMAARDDMAARRGRRRPESAPDHLDLPLLADLAPPPRPAQSEPAMRAVPPVPGRAAADPFLAEPHFPELHPAAGSGEGLAPEARPAEPRPSFPFRPVGPGPATPAIDDMLNYVPERARAPLPVDAPPSHPATAAPSAGLSARAGLSRDEVQRLQAALHELQECQRLLDAARDRSN